jgi:hypothetical protein
MGVIIVAYSTTTTTTTTTDTILRRLDTYAVQYSFNIDPWTYSYSTPK